MGKRTKIGSSKANGREYPPVLIRKLRMRAKDLKDPTRFVIARQFLRNFVLYYNVSNDTYAMNDISGATLFKRKPAAEAIGELLGTKARLLKVRQMKDGRIKRVGRFRLR